MPTISIIVPVYKVESYLSRCIDSILAQTFSDFSLILVDDGSPDGCGQICDRYAATDRRIHVIHQKNGGTSAARNAGIERALHREDSGWITFVDSDDWIHVNYLKVLYENAVFTGSDCSVVGYFEEHDAICLKPIVYKETPATVITPDELYGRVFDFQDVKIPVIAPWGKLFKKELFEDIRFPVGKKFEDRFTVYKPVFRCRTVSVSPQPLYHYYLRANSATRIPWAPGEIDDIEATREQIDFFEKHGANRSCLVAVRDYYRISLRQLTRIRALNNPQYHCYEKAVRKELARCLVKYGGKLKLSAEEKRQAAFALLPGLKRIVRKIERFIK